MTTEAVERPGASYVLAARHVLPVDAPSFSADGPLGAGVLVVGAEIAAVGDRARLDVPEGTPVVELPDAVLMPGLVNAHTHLELTGVRAGMDEPDFWQWIRALVRIKDQVLSAEVRLLSALAGACELAAGGVTTCGDTCDGVSAAVALARAGLRGVVYCEAFALQEGDVPGGMAMLRDRLDEAESHALATTSGPHRRVRVGVSPHAPYSVCAAMYRRVTELAAERALPVAVHLAESTEEVEFLRGGTGPFAEMYRRRGIAFSPYGLSPVAYLDLLGVLAARPLVIHAVQLGDGDAEALAGSGATIAHCPRSNAYFAHGRMPIEDLAAAGLAPSIGLGTDGLCSNLNHDLFEEARHAWLVHRAAGVALPAEAILEMMTLGGARALGVDSEVGSLTPGKQADIIALELQQLPAAGITDPCRAVVQTATGSSVRLVAVAGDWIQRDGRHAHLDADPLAHALRDLGQRLAELSP